MSKSASEAGGGAEVAEDVEREGEERGEQVDTVNGTHNTPTAEGREVNTPEYILIYFGLNMMLR